MSGERRWGAGEVPSPPVSGVRSAHVARALREAMESYAAPHVADDVLAEALGDAGRAAIPDDPVELRLFFDGFLGPLIESTLGEDAAAGVAARLEHLFALLAVLETEGAAARGARRSTAPPPSARVRPIFVVIGPRKRLAAELRLFLGTLGDVVRERSLETLAEQVVAMPHAVILDVRDLPARVPDAPLAGLAGVAVVVWGGERERERLEPSLPGARLASCSASAELRDLASLVRSLSGC